MSGLRRGSDRDAMGLLGKWAFYRDWGYWAGMALNGRCDKVAGKLRN